MSNTQPDPAQEPTPNDPADASDVPTPAQGDDDPVAEVARLRSELQKARSGRSERRRTLELRRSSRVSASSTSPIRNVLCVRLEKLLAVKCSASSGPNVSPMPSESRPPVVPGCRRSDRRINLAKFVGEDGTPDRDAVAAFVDRIAPEREPASPPDLGQGARGGGQQAPGLNSSQLQKDLEQALGIR